MIRYIRLAIRWASVLAFLSLAGFIGYAAWPFTGIAGGIFGGYLLLLWAWDE